MVTLLHGTFIHVCSDTSNLVENKKILTESLFLLEEYGIVTDGIGADPSLNYTASVLTGKNSTKFHLTSTRSCRISEARCVKTATVLLHIRMLDM
jgi:hypothetical protein